MAFARGFGDVDRDLQELNDRRERASARRFFVKSGESSPVVFLDEDPVRFVEYRLWAKSESRPSYVTKPEPPQRDRFLEAGLKADVKYAWSVIDCSTWVDNKGREYKNEKKLLVVSADIGKMLRDKKASWGGLKHKAVKISRKGKTDSSSGSDFELVMKNGAIAQVNLKAFKDVEPFDYEKVLGAPSDDESIRLLAIYHKGSNAGAVAIDGDDDLPSGAAVGGGGGGHQQDVPPAGEVVGGDEIPF